MVTRPLELESHLRPKPRNYDVFFFADMALLAVFFMLVNSQFVLAPGMPMDLPAIQGSQRLAQPADAVVSMRGNNVVLFEGGMFPLDAFQAKLAEIVALRGVKTVLVRVDRQVTAQGLLDLCGAVRAAGVEHVQIATEEAKRN